MYKGNFIYLVILSFAITTANGHIFSLEKIQNYARLFGFNTNHTDNELWTGIIRDCSKKISFSCIQKNAYTYLDRTFIDSDNITVFDGLLLTKNNDVCYDDCAKYDPKENLVEDTGEFEDLKKVKDNDNEKEFEVIEEKVQSNVRMEKDQEEEEDMEHREELSPLEEVTLALRKKAMKFISTRNYELQLPEFLSGANVKISPREIDDTGALIRVDFGPRALRSENENGRLFGIIRKSRCKSGNF